MTKAIKAMHAGPSRIRARKGSPAKHVAGSRRTSRRSERLRLDRVREVLRRALTPTVLLVAVLAVGVWARVWEFDRLPPGLNQDEASIAVEAYDLLHYGIDRNGSSFPVNFISWGNGMDALYGYVLVPFMLFGLSPLTVRLPNLLAGLLMLPLMYFIARRSLGPAGGLAAVFLMVISPWHILLSRWGSNENILPLVFGLSFLCMLLAQRDNRWFIVACGFQGLSLYAYGAAYVAVPLFLVCAVFLLWRCRRLRAMDFWPGLTIFGIAALPILLFMLINAFGWDSMHVGALTIPRLPVQARFLDMAATSSSNWIATVADNAWVMMKLLLIHPSDGMAWNAVDPYGYLYAITFPLAAAGVILVLRSGEAERKTERLLLLAWLFAAACIGLAQSANINRIGLVFPPLILCTAAFLVWLWRHSRAMAVVLTALYVINFAAFQAAYHGTQYRKIARVAFADGMLPALEYAGKSDGQHVCVTDRVVMPYIYVLFVEHPDPRQYLAGIRYKDPAADEREVLSLGRYTFGLENCGHEAGTIYVLSDEVPPDPAVGFKQRDFGIFRVYVP